MSKYYKPIFIFLILAFSLHAQSGYFGKNKVQYHEFKWHFLQSEHFDVYFYPGAYKIAVFVADEAESSYVSLRNDFKYEIKARVKIILYKSHNDFQQTNVIETYLPEGVGGVTELYKNRVVIPFEGSYDQLRHVLHHELVHAVMNDMLYGGSIQSLISGQVVPVPTWFAEGLAEYFSMRWDTRADMILRDATMTGYLPPIEYLSYYMAYQGGQSVFRYIARKYGNEKISEILHKLKGSLKFEGAFRSALGMKLKELSDEWQKAMRKEYWPDIADRQETGEWARALTHHKKTKNYLNISPALSPNGDKLIFLSDYEGKQSIYLMDVLEDKVIKRLIKGETSVNFEELHWLSPGMSWSPDGNKVTFTAKAGDQDALYIYDIKKEKFKQYKFNLDGIFSTAWSPAGHEIAFVGNKDGASDIYLFNVDSAKITNITNDIFSDSYPRWSADGQKIAFVSDRGPYIKEEDLPKNFKMSEHDFRNTDIYVMNRDGSGMRRVTSWPSRETDPVFSEDGNILLYTSDRSGISNIYRHDLRTDSVQVISNLLTGAFQLSVDKHRKTLAFASFQEGGWDIFTIKNPFDLPPTKVEDTQYIKRLKKNEPDVLLPRPGEIKAEKDTTHTEVRIPQATDYSHYVFADLNRRTKRKKIKVELKEDEYKLQDGHYKVRNYRVKFSPDIVDGAASYNTLWGFQGYTAIAFSDVLGNHKIFIGTNLVFDLRNSYLTLQYFYLPKRTDYGITLFHYANTYWTGYGLIRYRNYGAWLMASYPFSKFTRVDFSLNWWNAMMEYLQVPIPTQTVNSILPGLQLVHDTSEWVWPDTGPRDGFRGSVGITLSPKFSSRSPEFITVKTDLRKYFKLSDNYSIGLRYSGAVSQGKNPQRFFLGGVDNWLNRQFRGNIRLYSVYDIYFSEFITPLRGARYYERTGNTFSLINAELRFPLIEYLQMGLPPIKLAKIKGILFTDIGSAWDFDKPERFRGVKDGRFKDIVMGYGIGTRVYLGFLGIMFKYDLAWTYDLKNSSTPWHYLSIGVDF